MKGKFDNRKIRGGDKNSRRHRGGDTNARRPEETRRTAGEPVKKLIAFVRERLPKRSRLTISLRIEREEF